MDFCSIIFIILTIEIGAELMQTQKVLALTENEQTHFVKNIASDAKRFGDGNDLFPSVIIAQAALESAYGTSELAIRGNNLFGIKGTYGSLSPILITSNEAIGGKIESFESKFKSFPSVNVGMQDYVDKIVLGPGVFRDQGDFESWNSTLYAGVWRSHSKVYSNATLALEESGYSGDKKGIIYPNGKASIGYSEKLNNLIEKHNLTQYDERVEVFVPKITATPVRNSYDYGVWNDYKSSNKRVGGLSGFYGKEIKIVKEVTNSNGVQWVQFSANGKIKGWVAKAGIRFVEIPKNINKEGRPVNNAYDYGVWNDYESGNKRITGLSEYFGEIVKINKEVISTKGVKWIQFLSKGRIIGWVAEDGISYGDIPQEVSKIGIPTSNAYDYGIWDNYESGNRRITGLADFSGKQVEVVKEVHSLSGVKWVQFSSNGQIIGWVAESGIQYGEVPQVVSKLATPVANAYDYGVWDNYESGNQRITGLANFSGKQVEVVKEVHSLNGVKWVQFSSNSQVIGWVAESGIQYGEVPQVVSRLATPVANAYDYGVWDNYESGNQRITGLADFSGKQIEVVKEVHSLNGVKWVQFSSNGQIIGWVAESGIQYGEVPQVVSKLATPVANAYDYGVWDDYGADNRLIANLSDYTEIQVQIIKEVVSSDGKSWVQLTRDGYVLGWVNQEGITLIE